MPYRICKADKKDLKALDNAITDYNIQTAKELPRAEIERLDFAVKNDEEQLLGALSRNPVPAAKARIWAEIGFCTWFTSMQR